MSEKTSFFAEVKRGNVYKVAIAYGVVAWLLIQIATQVFPFLEIPNWVVGLVIVLIAIGFPIALVIAWALKRLRKESSELKLRMQCRRQRCKRNTCGSTLLLSVARSRSHCFSSVAAPLESLKICIPI